MPKIGRNEKCPCNSGKKYKSCCLTKDETKRAEEREMFDNGQAESNDDTKICMEYLAEEYPNDKVIDISTLLTVDSYQKFQTVNYSANVIMVAQKNDINKDVFASRGDPNCDMMVMYRGSYRSFNLNDLPNVTESIDKMIQTRMAGEIDK